MKVLFIYAHPRDESFNRAILEESLDHMHLKGHETRVRDLYSENFQPILRLEDFSAIQSGKVPEDIAVEHEHIKWADRIVFIHPIWWAGMPAILKGYIDRVFSYGFAYEYKDDVPTGLLTDKEAIVINTTGSPYELYNKNGGHQSIKFVTDEGILGFCGIKTLEHIFYGAVPFVDHDTRISYLDNLRRVLNSLF